MRYIYQGQNEIGACNEAGEITELRLLGYGKGAEIGAAIAMEVGDKTYVPIHDHTGSVACLLDSDSGDAVGTYRYSAFGEELFDGALVPGASPASATTPKAALSTLGAATTNLRRGAG